MRADNSFFVIPAFERVKDSAWAVCSAVVERICAEQDGLAVGLCVLRSAWLGQSHIMGSQQHVGESMEESEATRFDEAADR